MKGCNFKRYCNRQLGQLQGKIDNNKKTKSLQKMFLLYKADQHARQYYAQIHLILAYYHTPANLYALSFTRSCFCSPWGL